MNNDFIANEDREMLQQERPAPVVQAINVALKYWIFIIFVPVVASGLFYAISLSQPQINNSAAILGLQVDQIESLFQDIRDDISERGSSRGISFAQIESALKIERAADANQTKISLALPAPANSSALLSEIIADLSSQADKEVYDSLREKLEIQIQEKSRFLNSTKDMSDQLETMIRAFGDKTVDSVVDEQALSPNEFPVLIQTYLNMQYAREKFALELDPLTAQYEKIGQNFVVTPATPVSPRSTLSTALLILLGAGFVMLVLVFTIEWFKTSFGPEIVERRRAN